MTPRGYYDRWILAWLHANYSRPDTTAGVIHAALVELGILADIESAAQTVRRALYRMERRGQVRRIDGGAVWLWEVVVCNDP